MVHFGLKRKFVMQEGYPIPNMRDKGGRRLGMDRRRLFIPENKSEKRSGQDRRKSQERRSRYDPGAVSYLKRSMDSYMEYADTFKGMAYGLLLSLPLWATIIFFIVLKLCF
jgi:hypothetical protein